MIGIIPISNVPVQYSSIVVIFTSELFCLFVLINSPGLNRSQFDNRAVSFEDHTKHEHNMWHYLYFVVLIRVKDPTEFTGPESYVDAMVKDKNLEWFPRLRAISLAAAEQNNEEAEQSEMRSLQGQLEATQSIVATLSRQLKELRDQVRN